MIDLIINPVAGNGHSKKALRQVEGELTRRGIAYRVSPTTSPGHATELARQSVALGCDAIAVLGGDGLLSEVCAALKGSGVTVYFVPCGTGNDFIKTMKLPNHPLKALRRQLDCPVRKIDCGTVNEYTFLNIAGVGFDIEVLRQTERFRSRMRGMLPYICGLFAGLRDFEPFEAEVALDGVVEHRRYTILSVANGRYFGGGMLVAPRANPEDGVFDVMLVDAMPKWKLIALVPIFLPGWHTKFSFTRRVLAKEVLIKADRPFLVEVDGELKQVDRAHFVCRAQGITVSCP